MTEQPLPLDFKEQPNPPPRPSQRDEAIRRAAAETCLDDAIIAWAGSTYRPEEREDWIADLAAVIEDDGYHAARALDHKGWYPNSELCEILDGSWLWKAERDAVRLWVTSNCIKPKLAIGAEADTIHGRGTIVGIDPACALYTVQTDDWLAKNPSQVGGSGGYVIPFENCK